MHANVVGLPVEVWINRVGAQCAARFSHVQCVANKTTAPASNSHEVINPANMRQPRAFDIARHRSASSILLGSTSCLVGRSTGAFDVGRDPSGPVPMVEEATSALGLAICDGRALCLGLGGRCFFMAYAP
jgi:hypothetical protein